MATGRSNQITKQIGEYLVASALGRIGLVAATFSGNVPEYDIIATDSTFRSIPVQVKASNSSSWQFDNRHFVDVRLDGKRQVLGRPVPLPDNLVCVFVALSSRYGDDRFYVLSLKALQKLVITGYRKYLKRLGGVRPKKFDSFHGAITEEHLAPFKDAWILEFRDRQGLSIHDAST
jgi:hypothetical protein